jgi:histidyl-tRNA synthetase
MEIVKGFRDVEDAQKKIAVRNVIEETFRLYNFIPIESPIVESEKFVRGENVNDEAVGSVFKLQDRGKRDLALRYEFTFQLKRLARNKKLPFKRYQIGEVFRDEPIGKNRWRQFTQCDVDVVGSSVKDEAEVLRIVSDVLKKFNIEYQIIVNNRKLLNEILIDNKVKEKDFDNIIRELDKLDKLSEKEVKKNLERYGAEKLLGVFKKPEKYFEKFATYNEVVELKKFCRLFGVKVVFQPFLARGLTYYNGSIFEIKSNIKETIAAGGSYLVNGVQSTGISFGLDRIEKFAKVDTLVSRCLIVSLGQDKKAIGIASMIRDSRVSCSVFYGKPGKALDYANAYGIDKVIFVGDDEVRKGKYKVKDMESGREKVVGEKGLVKELV